jgi:Leucine-rich repeat (LRR) protein
LLLIIVQAVIAKEKCAAEKNNPLYQQCHMEEIPDHFFTSHRYSNIKHLRFSNNQFKDLKSSSFNGLSKLETLDLGDKQISELPDEIFKPLNAIKSIVLSTNKLTSIDFNQFAENQNLQELRLEHNLIENIQPIHIHSGGVFGITKLWLNVNKLVTISELCKLKDLTVLSLSNNPSLDFGSFNFSCWSELKILYLQNTNLVKLKHDYRLFAGLSKLTYLNLKSNNLEYFCAVNFPELSALESLFLDDNKLKQLNGTELITKFRSIKSISMFRNSWDCAAVRDFNNTNVEMIFEPDFKCHTSTEQIPGSSKFFLIFAISGFFVSITITIVYCKFF